jgi:histidine ammonia-lyase
MTRPSRSSLDLDGAGLTLDDAEHILRGKIETLTLIPAARKRVEKSRRCVETLLESGATIYGVNTGFGKLANQRIAIQEVLALQENLLRQLANDRGGCR